MIKTARINNRVEGERIDITVKNNKNHVLAPTWELVMGMKNGKISWPQYEEGYTRLLNERLRTRRPEFVQLIERSKKQDIVLVCFCTDERYCHRRLAKEFLDRLAATAS